eukprot:760551-Hanusia_phi.AAC.1
MVLGSQEICELVGRGSRGSFALQQRLHSPQQPPADRTGHLPALVSGPPPVIPRSATSLRPCLWLLSLSRLFSLIARASRHIAHPDPRPHRDIVATDDQFTEVQSGSPGRRAAGPGAGPHGAAIPAAASHNLSPTRRVS